MKHEPYAYTKKSDFLTDVARLKRGLPFLEDPSVLNRSLEADGKIISNRLLAQPIEGGDAMKSGAPSERTVRRYCELAAGGSGVIWMESISVNQEGKSVPRQMWLRQETVEEFTQMVSTIHETREDIFIAAQLTHSGRNSNPDGKKLAVCAFENTYLPKDNCKM
jgi:2,4-dienoyl-CoA reductase-like NADH-dependent reductase (Old Yellow Enzyme family)